MSGAFGFPRRTCRSVPCRAFQSGRCGGPEGSSVQLICEGMELLGWEVSLHPSLHRCRDGPRRAMARVVLPWWMNSPRGSGSLRQRRPGVWEVRVALGADPVSGRCRQRSVRVRGDCAEAAEALARWAALATVVRVARRSDPAVSLAGCCRRGWEPTMDGGRRRWPGTARSWPSWSLTRWVVVVRAR